MQSSGHPVLQNKLYANETKDSKELKAINHSTVFTLQDVETFYHLICSAAATHQSLLRDALKILRKAFFTVFVNADMTPLKSKMLATRIAMLQNKGFFDAHITSKVVDAIRNDIAHGGALIKKLASVDMSIAEVLMAIYHQYPEEDVHATGFLPQIIRSGFNRSNFFEELSHDNKDDFKTTRLIAHRYNEEGHIEFHAKRVRSAFHHYFCALILLKKIPELFRFQADKDTASNIRKNVDFALKELLSQVNTGEDNSELCTYFHTILMMLVNSKEEFSSQIAGIEYAISVLQNSNDNINEKIYQNFRAIADVYSGCMMIHLDEENYCDAFVFSLLSMAVLRKIPKEYCVKEDSGVVLFLRNHLIDILNSVVKKDLTIVGMDTLIQCFGSALLILLNSVEDYSELIVDIQITMHELYAKQGFLYFHEKKYDFALVSYRLSFQLLNQINVGSYAEEMAVVACNIAKVWREKSIIYAEENNLPAMIKSYQQARKFSAMAKQMFETIKPDLYDIDSVKGLADKCFMQAKQFSQDKQYYKAINVCQAVIYLLQLSEEPLTKQRVLIEKRYLIDIFYVFANLLAKQEKYSDARSVYVMAKNVFIDPALSTEDDQQTLEKITLALRVVAIRENIFDTLSFPASPARMWHPQPMPSVVSNDSKEALVAQEWVFTLA